MLEMNLGVSTVSGGVNTKSLLLFNQALGAATSTVDECGGVVTPNGINIVAGKFGNAMQLDTGSNLGVILPGEHIVPSAKKPFTVEMWLKMLSFTAGVNLQYFFIGLNAGNSATGFKMQTDASRAVTIQHYQTAGGGTTVFTSTKLLTLNVWSHIAFTSDGTNYYLHIDGVSQGSIAIPSGFTDPNRWFMGHSLAKSAAVIDSARISNIARYGSASFTVPASDFTLD